MTFIDFLDFIFKNAFHWWGFNSVLFPLIALVVAVVLVRFLWWFLYYCMGGRSYK